jgi:hypothetical protein
MKDPNSTFNLTALGECLFAEKRLLPLVDHIRRARDLRSLCVDLEMALESLDALDALWRASTENIELIKSTTESALLCNALVLYVRATKTSSDERGGFDLRPRFSEVEKAVHQELSDYRDKAIAHFGSGGINRVEWQAELVVLQYNGQESKPAVVTRRKMVDRKLAQRARTQIDTALALLRVLTLERLDMVTEAIDKARAVDPDFNKLLDQYPLNLNIFMTSEEAGEVARSSFDQGYMMGILRCG